MLDNPWVVGIGGGIVSGLFVYLITTVIVNKVSKKEYYKKVDKANREITVLLIKAVSEGRIPSLPVIESLLKSLTRSYGIKEGGLNGVKETLEDLIKEIFETKFISNDKKIELSESLMNLINENQITGFENKIPSQRINIKFAYANVVMLSVGFMAVFTSILVTAETITTTESLGYTDGFILPFVIGVLIAISFSLLSSIRRMRNEKNRRMNGFKYEFKQIIKKH